MGLTKSIRRRLLADNVITNTVNQLRFTFIINYFTQMFFRENKKKTKMNEGVLKN